MFAAFALAACTRASGSGAASDPTPVAAVAPQQAAAEPVSAKRFRPQASGTPSSLPPGAGKSAKIALAPVREPTLPPGPVASAVASPAAGDSKFATAPAGSVRPIIISVATNPSVVHTGETVTWSVRTSADVVSVTAHVAAYTLPLQLQSPGHFVLGFTIPSTVPAVFHGTYNLQLTARTQSGSSATRDVPMIFQ